MRVRGLPLVIGVLLLVSPMTAAGFAHDLADKDALVAAALFPPDLPDAQLLHVVAVDQGLDPRVVPLQAPAADATVEQMVLQLAARAGTPMAPEDVVMFQELDPRVAAPLLTLLVAVDQAWTMRDEAFSGLTSEEERELAHLFLSGQHATPRALELGEQVNQTRLVEAAILLLDTLESVVIPALKEAVAMGVWPPVPVADPVGIVRLGAEGSDQEGVDRLVQIDPAGDDTYHNNAGGSTHLDDLDPLTPDYPVAIHVDFEGDDAYDARVNPSQYDAQGGAFAGIGIMMDLQGHDTYGCSRFCQGASAHGIGYARDFGGSDTYQAGQTSQGAGLYGIGILREGEGDDDYRGSDNGGYSEGALGMGSGMLGTGLLWERGGADSYKTNFGAPSAYGFGIEGGRGWLVDEGPGEDYYETSTMLGDPSRHGCNTCTWAAGWESSPFESTPGGRGNDNAGGLAYLLTVQRNPP